MRTRLMTAAAVMGLLIPACATTTTTERVWTRPAPGEARAGQVEWVREVVQRTEGNPAAGAAAGAVVGGILGHMLTGGSRAGTAVGAVTGAAVGASESQGSTEVRTYDVAVRFEDGQQHIFRYRGAPPFRPGEAVVMTARGLMAQGAVASPPDQPVASAGETPSTDGESGEVATPPSGAPADQPPSPPSAAPAPPTVVQARVPAGVWAYTAQYGWIYMPYGAQYTFTPTYDYGDPYMYVYYPAIGWTWVDAPWLLGWGVIPYFHPGIHVTFGWYGIGWGTHWRGGHRPLHYRDRNWIRYRDRSGPFYRPRPHVRPHGNRPGPGRRGTPRPRRR